MKYKIHKKQTQRGKKRGENNSVSDFVFIYLCQGIIGKQINKNSEFFCVQNAHDWSYFGLNHNPHGGLSSFQMMNLILCTPVCLIRHKVEVVV